jgi:hypothetical protein
MQTMTTATANKMMTLTRRDRFRSTGAWRSARLTVDAVTSRA